MPVVVHDHLTLSDAPPCSCMLRSSGPQQITQFCSTGSEGRMPLVDSTLFVAGPTENRVHVRQSLLWGLAQAHGKPHTDTLNKSAGNHHTHGCLFSCHPEKNAFTEMPMLTVNCRGQIGRTTGR